MAEANWSEVFGDTPGPDFGDEKPQQKTTDWGQVFGDKPGPTDTSETATAKDEYEKLVQSKEAEANKIMKSLGVQGAIEAGIQSTPIVGPIVQGIGATVGAALPESLGFATGDTYSKRKEDLYAQFEAMQRAAEKQHPYVKAGTEVASSLVLPAGGISAVGEAATGSKLLGLGLEGATYGGASALAEKAGSKPESEQQGVGSSALLGGELGLGLGAAGATVGKAIEKFAPEWMSAVGNKDDYQVSQLAKAYDKDVKAGNVSMSFDDWMAAHSNGQPVNLADLGGPNVQKFVTKTFKNQPDLADQFRDTLLGRSQDASSRFSDFAQSLTDSDLNASQIIDEAKQEAVRAQRQAYAAAYEPENGSGTWNPQWSRWINLPEVKNAIIKTEDDLVNDAQHRNLDPNGRFPEINQVRSPFTSVDTPNGGFKLVMSSPQAVNMKYIDFLQRNLNDAIDAVPSSAQGGVKDSLINIRKKIISDVTNPDSDYYNAAYANAYNSTPLFRGQTDAFSYGKNLLSSIRDPVKASRIANETGMMTDAEKDFAMKGVMSDMLAKATKPDGSLDTRKLQQYFMQGNPRQAMMNAFGGQKYADLKRFVDAESVMAEAYAKSRQLGKVTSTVPRDMSTLLSYLFFDKYALAKVVADYGNKFMSDRYAKNMVQRLMSDDPQSIRSAYDDIINNKPVRGAFTNMLSRFVPVAGGQAGIQPMGRQTQTNPVEDYVNSQLQAAGIKRAFGGRVAYKKGGRVEKGEGGSLSELEQYMRDLMGDYGAKRVQRAADEIPGLEKMYTPEAIKKAFGEKNTVLTSMPTKKFLSFAQPLENNGYYYEDDRGNKLDQEQYVRFLAEKAKTTGLYDVPYLGVKNLEEKGKKIVAGAPYIYKHEGRHRNLGMLREGIPTGLARIFPNEETMVKNKIGKRLEHPEFVSKMNDLMGPSRMVSPETSVSSFSKNPDILHSLQKQEMPEFYESGGRIHKDDGGGTDTSGGPGSAPGGDGSMSGSEGMGAGSAGDLGGTYSQTVRNDSNLGGSDAGFSARAGDTPGFNTGMQRGVGPGVGEPSNQYGGGGGYGEAPVPQDMTVHGGPVFGGPNDQMSNLLSQTPGPALMQKALDNAGTFGGWFSGLNSPQPGNPYSDISMAGSQQMINNINAGNPSDFGTLAGIEGRYGSTQPAHPSTPTPGSAYGPDSSVNPASPTTSDNAYNYTPSGVAPMGGYSGIPKYQGVGAGSPVDAYNRQASPTANTVRSDFNNAFANAAAAGLHTFDWTNPVTGQRGTYAVKARATGGVVKRATGGRIPEVDKLYKAAKKLVDNSTKPMLNVDDDYIAKALRVAKGLV